MEANEYHLRAFERELKSRNLAPRTIQSYQEAAEVLADYLKADLADTSKDDLRGFFANQVELFAAATAAIRFRSLQQFFKWAAAEGVVEVNPMVGMTPPQVPPQPVAVLTLDQVKALLKTCSGPTFVDRRDMALFRMFLEPGGLRLSEMVGVALDELNLREDVITVTGKGRRQRTIPFGAKTGQALDRYVRERTRHKLNRLPHLWLGSKGPLSISGVQQMMRRRAAQAGIGHLHPHMLRHTAAHEWLAAGGQEGDALRLFGWRNREMLGRYGASAADARAQEASRKMSLGDRY